MKWLDRIPWWVALTLGAGLGLAPVLPEPHLWQKLQMLYSGVLVRPVDVFDLLFHTCGPVLVLLKLMYQYRRGTPDP